MSREYKRHGSVGPTYSSDEFNGNEVEEKLRADLTKRTTRTVGRTFGKVVEIASDTVIAIIGIIKSILIAIQLTMPIVAPLGILLGTFLVIQRTVCPYLPYQLSGYCMEVDKPTQSFPPIAEMMDAQVTVFDKSWTDLASGRTSYSLTLDRSSRALRDLNTQTKYSHLESRAELERQLFILQASLESTIDPMLELESATRSTMDTLIVFNRKCLDALVTLKARPKNPSMLAELDNAYQWTMKQSVRKLDELIDKVHSVQSKFMDVNNNLLVLQDIYNPEYNTTNATIADLASMTWVWRVLTSKNNQLRLSRENAELLSTFGVSWRELDEKVSLMKLSLGGFKADLKNARSVVADVELEHFGIETHIQRVEYALEHLQYNKIQGKQKEDSMWVLGGGKKDKEDAP